MLHWLQLLAAGRFIAEMWCARDPMGRSIPVGICKTGGRRQKTRENESPKGPISGGRPVYSGAVARPRTHGPWIS